MSSKILYLLILLQLVLFIEVKSQTFRTVQNGNWKTASTWNRTNLCANNNHNAPPQASTYWPDCPIDVIVDHNVNYAGNEEFGAGYFRSITVRSGGILNFSNNLFLSTGGSSIPSSGNILRITVESGGEIRIPNGKFQVQRNAEINIRSGGKITARDLEGGGGNGGTINIDQNAILDISNISNFNNGLRLNVDGEFKGNHLTGGGGGNSILVRNSGKMNFSGNVNQNNFPVNVEGNGKIDIRGNYTLTGSGQGLTNIRDSGIFVVGGTSNILQPFRNYGNAYVTFESNVILPNTGGAVFETHDNSDILIQGNLTIGNSGGIRTFGSSSLVICNLRLPEGSITGTFPNPPGPNGNVTVVSPNSYYGGCRILPVSLTFFNGKYLPETNKIALSWATEKEGEISHFEIEYSIDNIADWEAAGTVRSAGYSNNTLYYSFEDTIHTNSKHIIYYRIKQVDLDGSFFYSKIISIRINESVIGNNTWSIYPNPNKGEAFNLSLLNPKEYRGEEVEISLYNAGINNGFFKGIDLTVLSQNIQQKLQNSPKGVYILEIRWGKNIQHIKLLKN